jgi:hypothetical protein
LTSSMMSAGNHKFDKNRKPRAGRLIWGVYPIYRVKRLADNQPRFALPQDD